MQFILHNYWRSSASYRVRIALGILQAPYEYACVHLVKDGGQQKSAAFRAKNPMGQVPALEIVEADDQRHVLTQSLPIIEYLDERLRPGTLVPRDPLQRAHARALAELVNSGIQPLQNLSTTNRVKELGGDERAWVQHFMAPGLAAFAALAASHAGQYALGDAPTIADCALAPQIYSAHRFGVDLAPFPLLQALEQRYAAHPAFVAAHPDRQPDANS